MTEKIEIVNIKDVAGILKPADITELVKKAEELELPTIKEMEANIENSKNIFAKEFTKKEKKAISEARIPMKNNRLSVEKFAKIFKDYLNWAKNKVIETEKSIVWKLKAEEERLKLEEQKIDEYLEKEERKALLSLKKEKLSEIEVELTDEEILNFSEDEFTEFFVNKKSEYLERKEAERIEKERLERENFIKNRKSQMLEKLWEIFEEAIDLSDTEFVDFILNKKIELEEKKKKEEEERQKAEKIQKRKDDMLRLFWEIFEDKLEIAEEDFLKFVLEKTKEIEEKQKLEQERIKAEAEAKAKEEAERKHKEELEKIKAQNEAKIAEMKAQAEQKERERLEEEKQEKEEQERKENEETEKPERLEKEKKYQDFLKKNEGNYDKIIKEEWKVVLYKKIDEFLF